MKLAPLFVIPFFLLLLCGSTFAGIYSWTDKNGKRHFSDTPPPASADSTVKEVIKTQNYTVPVFKITAADDPGILGAYIPIHSGKDGLPQYELKREGPRPSNMKVPTLLVDSSKGRWQWKIKTGYSLYFSNDVQEGTPADKVVEWRKAYDAVSLTLMREDIETSRKIFAYNYRYGLDRHSPDLPDWQKVAFRVSGHPEPGVNGDYQPVDWSSEIPRYRTEWDMCLVLYTRGDSWQWSLGNCGMLSYSSGREPAETMPHQVKRWIKNAGMQITSFQVEQITQ